MSATACGNSNEGKAEKQHAVECMQPRHVDTVEQDSTRGPWTSPDVYCSFCNQLYVVRDHLGWYCATCAVKPWKFDITYEFIVDGEHILHKHGEYLLSHFDPFDVAVKYIKEVARINRYKLDKWQLYPTAVSPGSEEIRANPLQQRHAKPCRFRVKCIMRSCV